MGGGKLRERKLIEKIHLWVSLLHLPHSILQTEMLLKLLKKSVNYYKNMYIYANINMVPLLNIDLRNSFIKVKLSQTLFVPHYIILILP